MAPTLGHGLEEHCFLNTPVGWIRISADPQGLTELVLIDEPPLAAKPPSLPHLKEAYRQVMAYFRGERTGFKLPINPRGSSFQRAVLREVSAVPFGTTISAKELAARIGTRSLKAVRNPLPIVVPCHRVTESGACSMVEHEYGEGLTVALRTIEGVLPT